jgi:hypothetical protein
LLRDAGGRGGTGQVIANFVEETLAPAKAVEKLDWHVDPVRATWNMNEWIIM